MSQGEPIYDLVIKGGIVFDPANGVDGAIRDIWVRGGTVVDAPVESDSKARRVIDARGFVVMPGGVDVHCHIAGGKVNGARAMRPEEHRGQGWRRREGLRSGTLGSTPSTFSTGYLYAGLGYTTAVDASIPPLLARHAHHELDDTPLIDKAFLVLMGNNHLLLDKIKEGNGGLVKDTVAWLLSAAKGYGVKVVNPGGVERWKQGAGNVVSLDDRVDHFDLSPREIMTALAGAVDELGLPHAMHLHGLNLGIPGNWRTTLETMQALDGHRVHLAHVQFHSYGEAEEKSHAFGSRVAELADYVNAHDGISVDVGQVLFGETTSMTADGAVGQFLALVTGRKWLNVDVEAETGCGVVPITYSDKNFVHALQWAVGLEWFLRVTDPWKVALSTDHPNGGSFLGYPKIMALLMDRELRSDALKRLPARVQTRVGLAELDREYTLAEIAVITRAGPARMLGLARKGHLGPGADADITVYSPDDDKERMFAFPRFVIKAGVVVVDEGDVRSATFGRTLLVEPDFDRDVTVEIEKRFGEYTIEFANYAVGESDVARPVVFSPVRRGGA
jgi:formylmethanofuran dehydrogenase subunit A